MWVVVVAMVMVVMMPILETHPFNNLDFILNAWPSFTATTSSFLTLYGLGDEVADADITVD